MTESAAAVGFEVLDRLSNALRQARETRLAISPLTDEFPRLSIPEAYAVAQRIVAVDLDAGARIVGHKIGLTSTAVQEQLGVSEPDYGVLLDTMEILDGSVVDRESYVAPRVELELAFRLRERLIGPGVTADDVRRATAVVHPAIELVDSRIVDWRIRLADTVADNASSGAFVISQLSFTLDELDVAGVHVTLYKNGEVLEHGCSDAVLGDPCEAVAWLANALGALGEPLESGEIVLSGACTRMVAASANDRFRGVFEGLGELSLNFGEATR